jgi:hypothetical protein
MKTKNQELAEKYPSIRSRDHNDMTLGTLVSGLLELKGRGLDDDSIIEYFDREFLFGGWGFAMAEIREFDFTRDLHGLVTALLQKIARAWGVAFKLTRQNAALRAAGRARGSIRNACRRCRHDGVHGHSAPCCYCDDGDRFERA